MRWLLLHPDVRGLGLGRFLVAEAIRFSRASGYSKLFLWTVNALTAAVKLYLSAGMRVKEEETHQLGGAMVTEQKYEWGCECESAKAG